MRSRPLAVVIAFALMVAALALVAAPSQSAGEVRITAAGDFGARSATDAVLREVASLSPDVHLALGDLAYGDASPESAWCDYVKERVGEGFPFQLVAGNHESHDLRQGYINNYSACLPNQVPGVIGTYGREYYMDLPQPAPVARVIQASPALTFEDGRWDYAAGDGHYTWVADAIDDARADGLQWVIVTAHMPCLSVGVYSCPAPSDFYDLLLSKRVDLVLHGHEHAYMRTHQLQAGVPGCATLDKSAFDADCVVDSDDAFAAGAGTVFATVGTGGIPLRDVDPSVSRADYFASLSGNNINPTYGVLDMTITADRLAASFVAASGGNHSDAFAIDTSETPPNPPPTAQPETITLAPSDDAYVRNDLPAENTGSVNQFFTLGNKPTLTSYLGFELPPAPPGTTLVDATLKLRTTTASNSGSTASHTLDLAQEAFDEATLTYQNRPASAGITLGQFVPDSDDTAFDIPLATEPLEQRLGQPTAMSLAAADGQDLAMLWSKEFTVEQYRPELTLVFEPGDIEIDGEAPSVPADVSVSVDAADAQVGWSASTDNVGVAGYEVHRGAAADFEPSASTRVGTVTSGTSFTEAGAPAGSWFYRVVAYDAAGNRSGPSGAAAATVVAAATVTLSPAQDSWVRSDLTSENYGSMNQLFTRGGSPELVSYLGFDLPEAPPGTVLSSATLSVRTATSSASGSADEQVVSLTTGDWSESAVTWANRPQVGSQPLGSLPAGSAVDTAYDVALDTAQLAPLLGGAASMAVAAASGTDTLLLWSKEHSVVQYRPELTLDFAADPQAPPPAATAAAFLGDSYTAGTGASEPANRWSSLVAADQGWTEENFGAGGTGYLVSAGPAGCGQPLCPDYLGRLADVEAANPDVVLIAGGQNDLAEFAADPAAGEARVAETYAEAKRLMPDATLIAVGPSSPGGSTPTFVALDAAVQAAAATVGATYVSLLDPDVIEPSMVLPDGAHVGDDGHRAIADRVLAGANSFVGSAAGRLHGFAATSADRGLQDQFGAPWFGVGDAAWSLVGQLTPAEITTYLEDRAARGFRLVMFSAPEWFYADNAPSNAANDAAFTGTAFASSLNDDYWRVVDHALDEAERLGLTALVCPAYLGVADDGVKAAVAAASNADLYNYGLAVGQRYKDRVNVLWLAGHDTKPTATEQARYLNLQKGMKAAGDSHLWVAGGWNLGGYSQGTTDWAGSGLTFDVETAYDYSFQPTATTKAAWDNGTLPVIQIEGSYEGGRVGGAGTTLPAELRYQAWGSFVAGASSHVFGNDPVWHFGHLGGSWKAALASAGADDMSRFAGFLAAHDWADTVPDTADSFLLSGERTGTDQAGARFGGSHAVVYMPSERAVSLDLTSLAGSVFQITRIDPSTGAESTISATASGAGYSVPAQGTNADGDSDWVLLVEAGNA